VEEEIFAYVRERFRDRPECRFLCADFAALSENELAELATERFDTIVCINLLEHVRDDIGALLRMERLLVPGGTLALLVPAHASLYGSYDRIEGHWRRYGKAHLRTLLSHTGLRLLQLHFFNAAGAAGWWLQYRLLGRSFHDESHFSRMNRLLPWVRRVEGWVKPPFGLSLVAVCRREAE
jgi:SAM-dependent methyltransferase